MIQKSTSLTLVFLLIIMPFSTISAAVVKSSAKSQQASEKDSKTKNLDQTQGQAGVLNESKAALVNVDALTLQNYSNIKYSFNFDTYENVSLKSAVLEALSNSYVVKSANEKVIQSKIALKDAYSAYLPLLDFQYSNKYTKNFKAGVEDLDTNSHYQVNDEDYGFRIRQSLYSGGATALKIKSLQFKFEEAKRKYQIVIEQNIQNAIKAYFGVLFNYKNVQVNEKNMEKLNKILEITQVKYDSGALSIGDLSAIKANIANASGKLIRVKSALADALDYYYYIMGDDFQNTFPYQENFKIKLDPLEQVFGDIIQNNLSLINYRLNIESTKYKLLNIKASFKPKVDLELSYKNVLDKEDFVANEETAYAKVTFNYNIYNAGKDTKKTLQAYSNLRELKYRYTEEIKKIRWSTSKLYNSITSLDKTMVSTLEEVDASNKMVDTFWEGFQLGEQDLQVLLQGQRQLNSAELDLLKYKQDYITNIFKLIKDKGDLSKYFDVNSNSPDFLNFSNTAAIDPITHIDLSTQEENNLSTQSQELNTTIDEFLEIVEESKFEDMINFKDKFLVSNDDNYTLIISDFTNYFDAYKYIKTNRILQNAFSYEVIQKNGEFISDKSKKKIVTLRNNIAYGVFETKEDAEIARNNIFDTSGKSFTISKIKPIKDLYGEYIAGLETQIEPFIIKPKIIKTFITDQNFKKKFLEAQEYFFSINIVSLSKIKYAATLVKKEGIEKESFVFKYGRNGEWVKVMYGVFPTYSQAFEALSKHPELIDKYHPIIEKIVHKQKLYKEYQQYNGLPKWYYEEQKRIKEEKAKKKADEKAKKEAKRKAKEKAQKIIANENKQQKDLLEQKQQNTIKLEKEIETIKDQKIMDKPTQNNEVNQTSKTSKPSVEFNKSINKQKVLKNIIDNNTTITEQITIEDTKEYNQTKTQIKSTQEQNKTQILIENKPLKTNNIEIESNLLQKKKAEALKEMKKLQLQLLQDKRRKAIEEMKKLKKTLTNQKKNKQKAQLEAEKEKLIEEMKAIKERLTLKKQSVSNGNN